MTVQTNIWINEGIMKANIMTAWNVSLKKNADFSQASAAHAWKISIPCHWEK